MSHTPGPWTWEKAARDGHRRMQVLDAPDADQTVVFHDADWLPTKADARLIAAAPDLLTALKQAEAYVSLNAVDPRPPTPEQLASFRAAIAKAEGR